MEPNYHRKSVIQRKIILVTTFNWRFFYINIYSHPPTSNLHLHLPIPTNFSDCFACLPEAALSFPPTCSVAAFFVLLKLPYPFSPTWVRRAALWRAPSPLPRLLSISTSPPLLPALAPSPVSMKPPSPRTIFRSNRAAKGDSSALKGWRKQQGQLRTRWTITTKL